MFQHIEKIANRLTDNDRRLLSDIYDPVEVATPDADAFRSLCVTDDGRIQFWGMYRKQSVSTLDGKPEDVLVTEQKYFDFRPPCFDTKKNRILFAACENRFDIHPTAFFTVVFISDDCGDTWKVIHIPGIPAFESKPPHIGKRWEQNTRENTIAVLSNGRLMMITRTTEDYHYVYYSDDHGDTWSDPKPTAFHSMGTMPHTATLSDGRLLFLFRNTKPLPELAEADGIWEDVFTNRDAAHIAISEDDGKSWIGMRELALNPHRHALDFRSVGGPECSRDKSVHQSETLELPMGKLLIAYGQHYACRRLVIVDINWIYERTHKEDFIHGLRAISAQGYVKSILGGHKGCPEAPNDYVGHCAYNRICTALLMPSPDNNGKEALCLRPNLDDRLVTHISGATWNFPIARKGTVKIQMHTEKALRLSLLDFWMNPTDHTVADFAPATVVITPDMQTNDAYYTEVTLAFDCDENTVALSTSAGYTAVIPMNTDAPTSYGLCYLHMQTTDADTKHASYIARIDYTMA